MDRSWIDDANHISAQYLDGVRAFLDFAFKDRSSESCIYCPCTSCGNRLTKSRRDVLLHCIRYGFDQTYKVWTCHGEGEVNPAVANDNMPMRWEEELELLLRECAYTEHTDPGPSGNEPHRDDENEHIHHGSKGYRKMLEDVEKELIPGCKKMSRLSFIARLLHLKVLCHWSNNSIDLLLELLRDALPDDVVLPKNFYEANKLTKDLGFTCKTIHACINNCMLFTGEDVDREVCVVCGEKRFTQGKDRSPVKKLRYFPLIPRLQRWYVSSKTASSMRWHAEGRVDDGKMRHPADSPAWKSFDHRYPTFSEEIRNVRLGLATDGFNPFGNMSVSYSIWPVVLVIYNLPPWLCMKQPSFILSTIIDGPHGPGDRIDVFLQPLIDELKELWYDGVRTYDASTKEDFQMRAALLWTISDFPGYGMLSGWPTRGANACPVCGLKTHSRYLKNGHKYSYCGHRRFLPAGHRMRFDKHAFDGSMSFDGKPSRLTGAELLQQLQDMPTEYRTVDLIEKRIAQGSRKRRRGVDGQQQVWKKKSIFFQLPYWSENEVRHNLDLMHIEKNVCENVLYTLLGTKGKTKDNLNTRKDLQLMQIRSSLHPVSGPRGAIYLPAATYTMSNPEKRIFLSVLKDLRPPHGFSSNLSRRVKVEQQLIWGLKSHDCHVLMQRILPIAARRCLPKNVVLVLIELCNFFNSMCSAHNTVRELERIQERISLTLCHLEKLFPPSFFDVMEHLPIHLAEEAMVAGPVQYRWMYPIERYLGTLKRYVRNRAQPEGSIARGYLMEECVTFCSRYLGDIETKENRAARGEEDGTQHGKGLFGSRFNLDYNTMHQIHCYILGNIDEISPLRRIHLDTIRSCRTRAPPREVHQQHNEQFASWFQSYVDDPTNNDECPISAEIRALAGGPLCNATRYSSCIVSGIRYRVQDRDARKRTQCAGVMVTADTVSYASARDHNPREGSVAYYGILTDIVEVYYSNQQKYLLLKCDWVDLERGVKEDEFKYKCVNFKYLMYPKNLPTDEPFILATQASQVWYIADPVDEGWSVVVPVSRRDTYDVYSTIDHRFSTGLPLDDGGNVRGAADYWLREGIEGQVVEDAGQMDHADTSPSDSEESSEDDGA
ncbi:uncharacterized protein LOC127265929 [Andrographis paniculata]|uniref:uncharacterized protein LOC127265929 n=2 Tax=Andrographis paniculata TaxID=175694 RepID=UPI0021E6FBB4|nr:uncharacterized protein LOC127265929 [Andrographis paniculata]